MTRSGVRLPSAPPGVFNQGLTSDRAALLRTAVTQRSTDGGVFVVVEGSGRVLIDEAPIDLAPRYVVVIPSWTASRFEAEDTLVLFGYSDRACQEKLNLFREDKA